MKIEADCHVKAVTGRQGGKEGWVQRIGWALDQPYLGVYHHAARLLAVNAWHARRRLESVRLHPALEKHWRAMRPLAMICATPAVLGEPKGFLEGVAATSHPAFIDEIGGSLEETQPYTEGRVVWDANIITSRGVPAPLWNGRSAASRRSSAGPSA